MEMHDDTIAMTTFLYKGSVVMVSVLKPVKKWEDGSEFCCKYSFSGEKLNHSGESIGLDSMQALVLSIMKIGEFIQENPDIDDGDIEWDGGVLRMPTFKHIVR